MAQAQNQAALNAQEAAMREHKRAIAQCCSVPLAISIGDDPHREYPEWRRALLQRASTIPSGLDTLADIAAVVPRPAPPAMGEVPVETPAQHLQ